MSLKSLTPTGVQSAANGKVERWSQDAYIALLLRIGLGSVFVIGGWSKLSQLLDPARSEAIVALYTGPKDYINTFFLEYLFGPNSWLSPWGFLTTLSTFEFISGVALLVGFLVRPLALLYGFLLWTFVFSLPVVLTPGVAVAEKTYLAPALLVQIRQFRQFVDRAAGPAGAGHRADVVLLCLPHLRSLGEAALVHAAAADDEVDQHADPGEENHEQRPAGLAPARQVVAAEDVDQDRDDQPDPGHPQEDEEEGEQPIA